MLQPIRVLLVEDHQLVAEGIQALLDREGDIKVVGVAGSVKDAVAMSAADKPDVVVMDFRLPDGTGAQAGESIRNQRPRPSLVFVSGADSEDALLSAVQAGASVFLPKSRASVDVVSSDSAPASCWPSRGRDGRDSTPANGVPSSSLA